MNVKAAYTARFNSSLQDVRRELNQLLSDYMNDTPRIDRVIVRAKSIERFYAKSQKRKDNGELRYSDPLNQIQDQIGARIITFYLSDVVEVSRVIECYFRPVEQKDVVPDSEWEFGYFGKHYVLFIPNEVLTPDDCPEFFELQIKTLFQHAWSEAEHDLGYKPGATPLSADQKRRLAFTAAQAWGADRLFAELMAERSETPP